MKTLLLNPETGLYLQGLNKWTEDPNQAFDFKLADHARKFIDIWSLKNMELVFSFPNLLIPPGPFGRTAAAALRR